MKEVTAREAGWRWKVTWRSRSKRKRRGERKKKRKSKGKNKRRKRSMRRRNMLQGNRKGNKEHFNLSEYYLDKLNKN